MSHFLTIIISTNATDIEEEFRSASVKIPLGDMPTQRLREAFGAILEAVHFQCEAHVDAKDLRPLYKLMGFLDLNEARLRKQLRDIDPTLIEKMRGRLLDAAIFLASRDSSIQQAKDWMQRAEKWLADGMSKAAKKAKPKKKRTAKARVMAEPKAVEDSLLVFAAFDPSQN